MLPAGAIEAAADYNNCVIEKVIASNEETAAQIVQECCRAQAAFESYMADRLAGLKETRAQAERVWTRLHQEKSRAHAMVSATPSNQHDCTPL